MIEYFKLLELTEYKQSPLYKQDDEQYSFMDDTLLLEALIMSSTQINELSGYQIEEKWNNKQLTDYQINKLKIAAERQTNFLIRNGLEYLKSNSLSFSNSSFSQSLSQNIDLFISPEVSMILNQIGLLKNTQIKNYDNDPVINRGKIKQSKDFNDEYITRDEAYKNLLPYSQTIFTSSDNTINVGMNWNIAQEKFKVDITADNKAIGNNLVSTIKSDPELQEKLKGNKGDQGPQGIAGKDGEITLEYFNKIIGIDKIIDLDKS